MTSSNELQDRIQQAVSTTAPAFREVQSEERELSPEEEAARRTRRERELAAARAMIGEVRERLEGGLDEALANEDTEIAAEYQYELQRLKPLPGNVARVSDEPDYKRWIDPDSLRL